MGCGMFVQPSLSRQGARPPGGGRTAMRVMLLGLFLLGRVPASNAAASAPAASPMPASAQPSSASVVNQLIESARMWREKYRNDLALQIIQKALLVRPDDPGALAELGRIEIRSNQLDDASHQLFRLRTLYPDAAETRELGYAYMAATSGKQELAEIAILSRNKQSAQAVLRLQALFS